MNTSSPNEGKRGWFRPFADAARGIGLLIRSEKNARIHAVASVGVVGIGVYFQITVGEWIAIVLAMGLVWSMEAINSAIEWLCDCVQPEVDPRIRDIKDTSAGAVLLAAIAASVVGALVFYPYLFP